MNIRDIAKLAGVSATTVSKILNKKDQAISAETRQKVLSVIKKTHYQPSRAPAGIGFSTRSFLLGVVLQRHFCADAVLKSILKTASQEGYSVMARYAETAEEAWESIQVLLEYPIEGLLSCGVFPGSEGNPELPRPVPHCVVDFDQPETPWQLGIDYEKLGYQATMELIEQNHRQVLCVVHGQSLNEQRFVEGFRKCLQAKNLSFAESQVCPFDQEGMEGKRLFENTGAVCFDTELAEKVYQDCARKNRRIPRDFSVVSLAVGEPAGFVPKLTAVSLPLAELAQMAYQRLIWQIEQSEAVEEEDVSLSGVICPGESVDVPFSMKRGKIVVVGSINMDTTLYLKDFPQVGRSALTSSRFVNPGGKGLNQAVGIAKLEGMVSLIGKVGKDYEGSEIFDYLQSNGIDPGYVRRTSRDSTGHAYVCVQEDGESGIMVYEGANALLTSQEVEENAAAFDGAAYCLLPTELNIEVIKTAVLLAHKKGVKILLKPAAVDELDDDILQKTDIFMPNEKESVRLCPQRGTFEERAAYFLEKGVGQVIITLGGNGCYWSNGVQSQFFPAEKVGVVDTTGAADAFAAALIVFLTKGLNICESIRRATIAAGFSTTKWGSSEALIDWDTLEFLCSTRK